MSYAGLSETGAATTPVCRAINRPLTILGAERRLFFLAAVAGGAAFNFFGSLAAGAIVYAALFGAARWVTAHDIELPRILFNPARTKVRFDPGRFDSNLEIRA